MKKFFTAILVLTVIFICGCSKDVEQANHYERTEKMMGTLVTLKAQGKNSQAAVDESFNELFKLVENVNLADCRRD